MNIEIINITWRNVSDNLIPYFWRDISLFRPLAKFPTWLKEYVYCTVLPLEDLTNRLFEIAFDIEQWLTYKGQVMTLEFCLNDYFDSSFRRIFIDDDFSIAASYLDLYLAGEVNPNPFDIYQAGEPDPAPKFLNFIKAALYDFYVNVPAGLSFDQPRLEQIVNRYRVGGMRWLLRTF